LIDSETVFTVTRNRQPVLSCLQRDFVEKRNVFIIFGDQYFQFNSGPTFSVCGAKLPSALISLNGYLTELSVKSWAQSQTILSRFIKSLTTPLQVS
jgi:hypothetical protein